jgi:polar amino acid transport system substrate-binding protein
VFVVAADASKDNNDNSSGGNELMINRTCRALAALIAVAAFVFVLSADVSHAQQSESTWDQIKRTGKLREGVIDYPPYWYRDKKTGKWVGAMVEMAQDIAKTLHVELENVDVGGWGNMVLALNSNKIDMQIGLFATPQRAMAIDFAGPAYALGETTINSKKFTGGSEWADYNKPDIKLAVITGSADEQIAIARAPKAQRVRLQGLSDVVLAVTSGRADALVTTVMTTVVEKERNPNLGELKFPEPHVAMPGYIGLRMEQNSRFRKFLQRWCEWNVNLGYNEERFRRHLASVGVKEIPKSVTFSSFTR